MTGCSICTPVLTHHKKDGAFVEKMSLLVRTALANYITNVTLCDTV